MNFWPQPAGCPLSAMFSRPPILLARSLLAFEIVYGGGGDDHTMMKLRTAELLRVTQPILIDLAG